MILFWNNGEITIKYFKKILLWLWNILSCFVVIKNRNLLLTIVNKQGSGLRLRSLFVPSRWCSMRTFGNEVARRQGTQVMSCYKPEMDLWLLTRACITKFPRVSLVTVNVPHGRTSFNKSPLDDKNVDGHTVWYTAGTVN